MASSFQISDQNFVAFIMSDMHTTYLAHLILLDFITLMIFGEVYRS